MKEKWDDEPEKVNLCNHCNGSSSVFLFSGMGET